LADILTANSRFI